MVKNENVTMTFILLIFLKTELYNVGQKEAREA